MEWCGASGDLERLDADESEVKMGERILFRVLLAFLCVLLLVIMVAARGAGSYAKIKAEQTNELTYTKDTRTGLCFAHQGSVNSSVMSNVPCTDAVERLIKEQAR